MSQDVVFVTMSGEDRVVNLYLDYIPTEDDIVVLKDDYGLFGSIETSYDSYEVASEDLDMGSIFVDTDFESFLGMGSIDVIDAFERMGYECELIESGTLYVETADDGEEDEEEDEQYD